MIAALGMYDMPAIRGANDRLWQLIRDALGYGPEHLTRDTDPWQIWMDPDLLLAQTCGLPFRAKLRDHVTRVGTPDYGLPGCAPGYYCSVLLARHDELRTLTELVSARFAYNEELSQSGWAAACTVFHTLDRRPSALLKTGSHVNSAHAVAEGRADLAALDMVTWLMLCDHDPVAALLKPVGRTPATPGLPIVTARNRDPAPIAAAIRTAIAQLTDADSATLRLRGLAEIPDETYLGQEIPPTPEQICASQWSI